MKAYIRATDIIDWERPDVRSAARALAHNASDSIEIARRCFEFVRDEVPHSWDHRINPVTLRASEALAHRTGFCYSKSHLLAALLRANGIPAGICYQRLEINGCPRPFALHALNAVHLDGFGWYRVDARGNRSDVDARFDPPNEWMAFFPTREGEMDLPEIWADPLPVVVETLARYRDIEEARVNLPDCELWVTRARGAHCATGGINQ